MKYRFERDGHDIEIEVVPTTDGYLLSEPGQPPQRLRVQTRADGSQVVITPWGDVEATSARRNGEVWAHVAGRRLSARVERARASAAGSGSAGPAGVVRAPMAGKLLRRDAQLGDQLRAGQPVAVIEAMKMENELVAPFDGVVVEVGPAAPSTLEKGALILRLDPR